MSELKIIDFILFFLLILILIFNFISYFFLLSDRGWYDVTCYISVVNHMILLLLWLHDYIS